MNNSSSKVLGIAFIIAAFSKEFLVFNEEVLVLFAFFIFIYLAYKFGGNLIALDLDARSSKILEEFNYYKDMQEKTLVHLVTYHNKQKHLSNEVKGILTDTKMHIDIVLSTYSKLFLKLLIINIEDRLKKVVANESKFNVTLQNKINGELYQFLISKYSTKKNKQSSLLVLMNSISCLSGINK